MRQRPRILKVFINPFGGKKRAVQIYEKDVRPLWELAGILLDETGLNAFIVSNNSIP